MTERRFFTRDGKSLRWKVEETPEGVVIPSIRLEIPEEEGEHGDKIVPFREGKEGAARRRAMAPRAREGDSMPRAATEKSENKQKILSTVKSEGRQRGMMPPQRLAKAA